jgi:hypothetical protein
MAKLKKSHWDHVPLLQAIEKHIQAGILRKSRGDKDGVDYLLQELQKEFKEYFEAESVRFTKFSLKTRLPQLIWNKERNDLLEQYITEGWPLERFYGHFPYLPKDVIDARVKKRRGQGVAKQPAEFIRGLFRLVPEGETVKPFGIPEASVEKPLPLKSEKANGLMLVHAPSIGLPYDGHMSRNVLRCTLEVAEREGYAVLITGGLFHMRLKQASGNTQNYRARTSAMDLDMEIFPPDYREVVEEGIKSGTGDFPIFMNLFEGFENLRSGVKKIFESGRDKPFSMPMHYVPGMMEELLITIGAYHEIRARVLKRQNELGSELRELNALAKPLRKAVDAFLNDEENTGKKQAVIDIDEVLKRLDQLKERVESKLREKSKTIITNSLDQDNINAYEKVRSWVLTKLEDAMPGVKIVGFVSTHLKYKDAVIEIAPVGGESVSLASLDRYIQTVGNDRTRHETLPDAIILANQYNPHFAMTYIAESKYVNAKQVRRNVPVMLLPAAIDGDYVARKFKDRGLYGTQTKIQQMVNHSLFQSGVVVLDRVSGTWTGALYSVDALRHLGGPLEKGQSYSSLKGKEEYYNIFHASDLHFGHPWMIVIQDPKTGRFMDQTSATINILREQGGFGRIHQAVFNDDIAQGQNFPNYNQPHENVLTFADYQEYVSANIDKMAKGTLLSRSAFVRELFFQKLWKGEYRSQEQFQMFKEMLLKPNLDFWADVIKTHFSAKSELLGYSKLTGQLSETRDAAIITFPNGNHWRNLDGKKNSMPIGEGKIAEWILQAYMYGNPIAKTFADRLDDSTVIGAPMSGQEFIGLGVVDTKSGGRLGLHMRGYPVQKGPANGFPLENAAKRSVSRGNFYDIMHDVDVEFQSAGDIHKAAMLWVPKLLIYTCPAAVEGDPYGNLGFAKSHIGNMIVSYEKRGTTKAPIRFTYLMGDWIESYYEKSASLKDKEQKVKVDIERLIPNPA